MLATCAGIYNPADPKCAYACDNLMDQWDGVIKASGLEAMSAALDTMLCCADKQMSNNNWCYVAGNKAGPADFCVSHHMLNMVRAGEKVAAEKKAAITACYAKYPKVLALVDKIANEPKLCVYLAKRPSRSF